ncbi:MAG TPA: hypothetical protein VN633_21790 [Bryobacteraceae bacterium]|nr:hypothetical protein [Bryobacteraceae bacterium]
MISNAQLQRWASYLIFAGLILSFCASAITNEAIRAVAAKGLLYTDLIEKPRIYYPFHAGQLFCMMAGGMLALLALRKKAPQIGFYPFLFLLVVGLYIALRGYSVPELFSKRIVNPRGPMQCWVCAVAFAGVYFRNWKILGRGIYAVAILLSVYCAYIMVTLGTVNRSIAMNNLTSPLNPLYWAGVYTLLTAEDQWLYNRLKWIPISLYALGSIITQTRLNLIMVMLAFIAYLFLRAKEGHSIRKPVATVILSGVGVVLIITLLSATSFEEKLDFYQNSLANRLTEDSRSEQVVAFFSDVPVSALAFGKGAEASWNWDGNLWKGGTDIGYLSVLFFGGVPMLIGLYLFMIRPALKNAFLANHKTDLVAPVILILFAIRMFSSEFPSLDIEYYPILLATGRCWGFLAAAQHQIRYEHPVAARPVQLCLASK